MGIAPSVRQWAMPMMQAIGGLLQALDEVVSGAQSRDWRTDHSSLPLIEGMKHCILAYVFRLRQLDAASNPDALSRFFYHFNDYMNLVIWKVRAGMPRHGPLQRAACCTIMGVAVVGLAASMASCWPPGSKVKQGKVVHLL